MNLYIFHPVLRQNLVSCEYYFLQYRLTYAYIAIYVGRTEEILELYEPIPFMNNLGNIFIEKLQQ